MGNWISLGVSIGLSIEYLFRFCVRLMIPRGAIPAAIVANYHDISIYMRRLMKKNRIKVRYH